MNIKYKLARWDLEFQYPKEEYMTDFIPYQLENKK